MKRLHLNTMTYGLGSHISAWRMPENDPLAATRLQYWVDLARQAEEGGFDAIFLGDLLALQHEAPFQVSGALDPLMILAALAAATSTIGLIGTASTTYDHPYHIARRFASLDHISEGRAGWNIVTSSTLSEAKNFGRDVLAPTTERYARARDVVNAVSALWDSWKPGARIADKDSGLYLDTQQIEKPNYFGSYTRSVGPLDVPHPPQGRPLLVQGGTSDIGRDFAGSFADISFTVQSDIEDAREFYADIKRRARDAGRSDDSILVFPGIVPIIGNTREEALSRIEQLNRLTLPNYGRSLLSRILDFNLDEFEINGHLPTQILDRADDHTASNQMRLILKDARKNNLTIYELSARFLCSRGHLLAIGTANDIADTIQEWFESNAADGLNVLFPVLPGDLTRFTCEVMPILEKRGLRQQPQKGEKLRERFGLPIETAL